MLPFKETCGNSLLSSFWTLDLQAICPQWNLFTKKFQAQAFLKHS
jgi:hypothetical protein